MVILVRLQTHAGSCALSSGALQASVNPAVMQRGGMGKRTQVLCRARVFTVVRRDPRANRAAALPATQPSSQPDFPIAGAGPLAPPAPFSHSCSWHALCAPDVRCRIGRPIPDGYLVAELASHLHHFCIIPPATELWWKEKASVGGAVACSL